MSDTKDAAGKPEAKFKTAVINDPDNVERVIGAYIKRSDKITKSVLKHKGEHFTMIGDYKAARARTKPGPANGIEYTDKNGKIFASGDCEMIARVTACNTDYGDVGGAYVWRWGYTIDEKKFVSMPKRSWTIEAMNQDAFGGPMLLVDYFTALCAEKCDYEYVEEVRLSPDERVRYLFGLKNMTKVTGKKADPRLKDMAAVVEACETNPAAFPPGMKLAKLD